MFEDTSRLWLRGSSGADAIQTYSNDSGFIFSYLVRKSQKDDKDKLRTYPGETEPCCNPNYYNDYFLKQAETIFYDPRNGGFSFQVKRILDVNAALNSSDSLILNSKQEFLELRTFYKSGYKTYRIEPDTTLQTPYQVFHSSINLRGKTHYSVFELIDAQADTNKVLVKGYYLSFDKGIIGFYLTNGELWLQD